MDASETVKPIDIGAPVIGVDGAKLGKVEYVVVRPDDMQITDIVVSTGVVLGREIVVPVRLIRDVQDGKVNLSIDKEELKQYPDYIEINYEKPPTGWIPPEGMVYPATGIVWPVGAYYNPEASGLRVNAPPGTLGIREGMPVETVDGHKVGSVDALDVDITTREIRGFEVKHGLLFSREVHIPAGDVLTIRDGRVILALTKEQAQQVEKAASQRPG